MNIKSIIENFEQHQKTLENKLNYLRSFFLQETRLWKEYDKMEEIFFLNDKAINFLGDTLQKVDDENILLLFSLNDVKKIYELLVEYYPDNIQYQQDLISFVYNVLDDEDEVKTLIDNAEKRISKAHKYFVSISDEIENRNVS